MTDIEDIEDAEEIAVRLVKMYDPEAFDTYGKPISWHTATDMILALVRKAEVGARIDELNRVTHSDGSLHIIAERADYQFYDHDPAYNWSNLIIILKNALDDRIVELRTPTKEKDLK